VTRGSGSTSAVAAGAMRIGNAMGALSDLPPSARPGGGATLRSWWASFFVPSLYARRDHPPRLGLSVAAPDSG
jgi:hypothetical protein